jgi:hypothetical protein
MRDNLSSEVSYATVSNSTPNEPTQIVEWDVPDGQSITLREGEALIFDAKDTNGDDLPSDTRFALAKARPDDELGVGDLFCEFTVRPYNQLSLSQQQSGDNADRRRLDFDPDSRSVRGGSVVQFDDSDRVVLYCLSSQEVDSTTIRFDYPARVED